MARSTAWLLLVVGITGLLHTHYLQIKASLAQHLISQNWQSITEGKDPQDKPWKWADFSPIARLRWKSKEFFVLSSTSGQALAFGPGHIPASSQPGQNGRVIIAGHNDSHFAFLEHIQHGDELLLESAHGKQKKYKINHIDIVDSRTNRLLESTLDELVLVTCYPFRSLSNDSPWRLVVNALAQPSNNQRKSI